MKTLRIKNKKRIIVHVNRLKKFNQRQNSSTITNPNNQELQENTDTQKAEKVQANPEATAVKRGRGRPRKNVQQAGEVPLSKPNKNYTLLS